MYAHLLETSRRICPDDKSVVSGTEEEIDSTLRDVDHYSDVDVHEARLDHEENRLPGIQWFRLYFALV